MIRKITRFSRVTLAALTLTGFVVLTLLGLFGERTLRHLVESRLTQALDRQVLVGALSVNLPKRVVELRNVVIPGLAGSRRPSLVASRIRLALSLRSLFTSKILLRGLECEQLELSLQVFPDGSTDLPRASGAGGGAAPRQISIGKLIVRAGTLFLNDQQVPLEVDWPDFEASLTSDSKNFLAGDLSAGPGPMRFGELPAQDARFELGVRLANSILHIDRGSFTASGTHLALGGEVDLRRDPKGSLSITGPFDLASFDQNVAGSGLDLLGIAEAKTVLSIGDGRFALEGTLLGRNGSYASLPIDSFSTGLSWDGSDLHLRDLSLEVLAGTAVLEVDVPANEAIRVKGTLSRVNAEPLLHWLFNYGTADLGSRVSGPIDLSFPRGATNLLSGTADLVLSADQALGEPLSGRWPLKADRGLVTMTGAQLEVPRTMVMIDGSIQPDLHLSLGVKLVSEDLAATDSLGVRIRRAIGIQNVQPLGVRGQGTLEGRATGTVGMPAVVGRFQGTSVVFLGVPWGSVDWEGTASGAEIKSDGLVAVRGAARAEMSGLSRLGAVGIDDAIDLNMKVRDWPSKDLLTVVDSTLDIEAPISGSIRLLGTRAKPLGQASLKSAAGKAAGVLFGRADLDLRFEGEALRVESLAATLGGGELKAKGLLTEEAGIQAFSGLVELNEVELSDLGLQNTAAPMIGGHVNGSVTLGGPIERPRIAAHLESKRIFYGDEGVSGMTLDINGAGDGVLNVTARSDSPRFSAAITGTIEATTPYQSQLEAKLERVRVDPVLRALGSRFENAVVITAAANARIEGPLAEPESIVAQVRDTQLRVAVPEYSIEAVPGSVIDVERGEVRIAGLTLTGEGTSLNVSGRVALRAGDKNDLAVTGRADLRVFGGFFREWRLRGSASLRSQIGGTPRAVRISGGLDVEDGSVRLRTFPQGLDGLNGRLVFNETQARVAGLEGRFGGGRVSVSGQMGFGGTAPASFDLSFTGDSLGLRYPDGLKSTFGASLRLQGTSESHWLTGSLLVSKALWTRKYVITTQLLSSQAAAMGFARTATLKSSPMHLDIAIDAPGTLRLDNNLASLVAKANLTLTGSPTEPQLLGRVEIERGKVFFRGNTYEVRKGVAQFSNPREINPVFDIEADTRLRSYRLTLLANGTLDRVSTRITSDPPLTSPQIASLLTGGDENEVAGSRTDIKSLGTGGVNSLASSWLDDNLTGKFAEGFGLSRLSIDPGKGLLSRTGSRLTVGKRVTEGLEVVYSRNIFGGTESQIATAEYSLTNRFSLVVSWAEPGGLAADLRTRFVVGR